MCPVHVVLGVINAELAGGVFGSKKKYLLPSFFKLITGRNGSCDWTSCSPMASTAYTHTRMHTQLDLKENGFNVIIKNIDT